MLCDLLFMFSVTEICDFWNMREPYKGLKPSSRQIGPDSFVFRFYNETRILRWPLVDYFKTWTYGTQWGGKKAYSIVYMELEASMKVKSRLHLWSICFVMCFCSNIQEMRARHKDAFLKKHNLKLGFMSAFVKASAFALQEQPVVNAGEFVVASITEVLGGIGTQTCSHTHRHKRWESTDFTSYLWKHFPGISWFTFLK